MSSIQVPHLATKRVVMHHAATISIKPALQYSLPTTTTLLNTITPMPLLFFSLSLFYTSATTSSREKEEFLGLRWHEKVSYRLGKRPNLSFFLFHRDICPCSIHFSIFFLLFFFPKVSLERFYSSSWFFIHLFCCFIPSFARAGSASVSRSVRLYINRLLIVCRFYTPPPFSHISTDTSSLYSYVCVCVYHLFIRPSASHVFFKGNIFWIKRERRERAKLYT